MINAKCYFKSL